MIKKQLLVILATIVLSFSAFAQFGGGNGSVDYPYLISTKDHFLAISDLSQHYKQTADINLGDLGSGKTSAIITGTFSGIYDGDGHSISYSVEFFGTERRSNYGLFGEVSGTIKNLRITSSTALLSGTGRDMNVGLICGLLLSDGVITDCHVTGNINSTVTPISDSQAPEAQAGSDAGLIAGQSLGEIKYSSGTGNVVGVGYAGGLVGQLNDKWSQYSNYTKKGKIIGCSFVGSVTALKPYGNVDIENEAGNFAGGICGLATNGNANPEISLSYANATLESNGGVARGLAYFTDGNGTISDIYVKGTVNDDNIDTYEEISNISSGNRYDNTNHNSVEINSTLNSVVGGNAEANEKIYFSRETGEIILVFGQPSQDEDLGDDYIDNEDDIFVCEPLQGAIIIERRRVSMSSSRYRFYARWPSNQGDVWYWELKKDDGSLVTSDNITHSDNSLQEVEVTIGTASGNDNNYTRLRNDEYVFSVRRVCSDEESSSTYETFKVNSSGIIINADCYSVENLAVRDITTNSAVVSWTSTSNSCKYRIDGGNYTTIQSSNGNSNGNYDYSVTLTDLTQNTTCKIEVRAICDNNESKSELIEFKTDEITINSSCDRPTGLHIVETTVGGVKQYTAKWIAVQDATWEYLFKDSDGNTIIDGDTTGNSVSLGHDGNGGLADGEYVFSVRRKCEGVDNTLNRYETCLINIDFNCDPITGLSVSSITANSAVVDWQEESGSSYQFKLIKPNGEQTETLTTNQKVLAGLTSNTLYTIEIRQICSDGSLSQVEIIQFKTQQVASQVPFETVKDGNFEQPGTWNRNSVPTGNNEGTITIKHEVVLNSTLTLNGNTTINIDHSNENKGVLKIDQQGQLITTSTTNDVTGIVEILTPIIGQKKWAFLGAPFVTASDDEKQYKLETIMPERGSDIIVSFYEYGSRNDWSANRDVYATYQYEAKTGEGYLGFPFYDGVVSFTSYGDLWDFSLNDEQGGIKEYDATPALYKLNNSNVTITNENSNRWIPLSNPYPAKLNIEKFLSENSYTIQEQVVCKFQGQGVYKLANAEASAFDLVSIGEIKMTEGFFVKLASGVSSIDFRQTQLTAYPAQGKKSQTAEREFVELSLTADNHSSKLYFAHNEQAELGYDIFDADKLFAMVEMTEPYFVTEGISLVKEEVNALPYYATMNVRSYENKEVSFKANNIPQGIAVSLIDGEETIELNEGVVYTTNVSSGENANRFKVLFSQSVGLNDVEELEVNITNDNRLVNITTTEKDLQIEVYNALGQRVFATKDFNFSLNNVSAGAYMIKAFNNKASKTQKIIIK